MTTATTPRDALADPREGDRFRVGLSDQRITVARVWIGRRQHAAAVLIAGDTAPLPIQSWRALVARDRLRLENSL